MPCGPCQRLVGDVVGPSVSVDDVTLDRVEKSAILSDLLVVYREKNCPPLPYMSRHGIWSIISAAKTDVE